MLEISKKNETKHHIRLFTMKLPFQRSKGGEEGGKSGVAAVTLPEKRLAWVVMSTRLEKAPTGGMNTLAGPLQ